MIFVFRRALMAALLLALAACGARPGPEALIPQPAAATMQEPQPVWLVTTRLRHLPKGQALPVYTDHRSPNTSQARFDIALPQTQERRRADEMTVATRRDFDDYASFAADLRGKARKRDVLVFVHGYNTSLPEALFSAARLSHNAGGEAVPVVFSWPSAASLAGYIEDRDAADFSRAALADLLTSLARSPDTGRVFLLGHSMGGRLSMESLVQLQLAGRTDVLRKTEVVLADPDIDVDLFWSQAAQLGPMQPPLVVLTAPDDKALGVSSFLAGKRARIGGVNVLDPVVQARADAAKIRIVDISAVNPKDTSTHSRFIQLAGAWQHLPASGRPGAVRTAGAFVLNTVGAGFSEVGQALAK